MDKRVVRGALVSTDSAFRELVRQVVEGVDRGIRLGAEIAVPFASFSDEQLRLLRSAEPDLIFLDLENDPVLGIKLAQFLVDANPGLRFIAAGPMLEPEQLMAAMRAGISDYLRKPVTFDDLIESFDRLAHKLGRGPAEKKGGAAAGKIYSFFSPKGGSGSTTVATNTAIHLHRLSGRRTLLLDLDLELGEVALLLGVQAKFNFVDLVQNFHRMDAGLLSSYIERHESGVDLLSAPYHPDRAEVVTGEKIRHILQFLRQHYDYIVVDTSKSFTPSTLATFEQSDLVFLVTTVDLSSLRNIQRGLPMLKRMLPRGEEQIRLVVNRYNSRDAISIDDVKRAIGLSVYWTLSNDYEAVTHSHTTGKPIVLNGTSAYAKDLKALVSDVAGLQSGAPAQRGVARLLSRLRGVGKAGETDPKS